MAESGYILQMIGYAIPLSLIATVGAILSLVNRRRIPGAAMLSLFGCCLLLLTTLSSLVARILLWEQLRAGEIPHEQYGYMMSLVGILASVGNAGGITLLIVAVFVGRKAPRTPPVTNVDEV
jgi:uncharacterized membrane protein YfcA